MDLTLNEPVVLPWPGVQRVQAIFWIRIYRDGRSAVVIIADVPGNPGPWPDTVDSQIVLQLSSDHGLDELAVRWFVCYPGQAGNSFAKDTRYYEAHFSGTEMIRIDPSSEATKLARSAISAAIGRDLDLLPPHEEVLGRVLAIGGKLKQPMGPARYIVLPRGSIPVPPSLYRCPYQERYMQFLQVKGYNPNAPGTVPPSVRKEYFDQLTEAEYQTCPYHQANWRAIATEAVRIVRTLGEYPKGRKLSQAIAALTALTDRDKKFLKSLLGDSPIQWSGDSFVDGSHRACALRHSGAPEIVRGAKGPAGYTQTWRIGDSA